MNETLFLEAITVATKKMNAVKLFYFFIGGHLLICSFDNSVLTKPIILSVPGLQLSHGY